MRRWRFEIAAGLILIAWCALFIHRSRVAVWPGEIQRTACLFDDAMIGMRYAENLVQGEGLVWNPGEWVEGYTNFLWVLAMALLRALAPDSAVACHLVQAVGILFMLAIGWATRRLALRLTGDLFTARLSAVLAVSYYPLLYWSLTGMETGLAALCVLLAAGNILPRPAHPRVLWVYPLASAAGVLTRPDLLLVGALFLALRAWRVWESRAIRLAFAEALLFALPVAAHLVWRHATYGAWLPNTYVLKVEGFDLALRLANGLAYSLPYWKTLAVPALAVFGGILAGCSPGVRILLAPILTMHLYQVWVGGDPWPLWRFTCPVFPLLAVLIAASLTSLARRLPRRRTPARFPTRRGFALGGTALAFSSLHTGSLNFFLINHIYQRWDNQVNVWRARAIRHATEPDAVVACFWAGTIPCYSGRRAADFLGKTDPRIARLPPDTSGAVSWNGMRSVPGHNKYDLPWSIATYRPDVIADERVSWGRQDLASDPAFRARYQKVRHRGIPANAEDPAIFWVATDSPRVRHDRLVSVE